jgi:hypothetical protein
VLSPQAAVRSQQPHPVRKSRVSCRKLSLTHVQSYSSLEGSSLPHFKFLQELRLYDNKLKDLQGTLEVLSRLSHLRDLDLFGNAVVEEEHYRLQVIRAIPSLDVLDRHVITAEERAKAARWGLRRCVEIVWSLTHWNLPLCAGCSCMSVKMEKSRINMIARRARSSPPQCRVPHRKLCREPSRCSSRRLRPSNESSKYGVDSDSTRERSSHACCMVTEASSRGG